MTRTTWRRLAVFGVGAACCLGAPIAPGLGVAPADAKAFYTRKRVNGTWVEGRFPTAAAKATKSRVAARGRKGRAVAVATVARTAPAAPAAPLPPRPERSVSEAPSDRLSHLHRALQAKAQALAAAPAEGRPGAVDERPIAGAPRSVLLDFQTGLKTTQFEGDVVVREPFDVGALRGIASPAPTTGPAASAGSLGTAGRRPRT